MARTQEDRKADTRARLLSAAAKLFAAEGFGGVSVDAVADAADRTSGSVYSHFGGKAGLLEALLDSWEGETAREVGAVLEADPDAALADNLRAVWASVASPPGDRAGAWMQLEHELWLYAARNPEAGDALAARYAAGRHGMAGAFDAWIDGAGCAPQLDAEELATVVLALLFGLEMVRRPDPTAVPDDLAERALSALFGCRPG